MTTPEHRRRRLAGLGPLLMTACLVATACSSGAPVSAPAQAASTAGTGSATTGSTALFDVSMVHDISIELAREDFDAMIEAYLASGDKAWLEATVTIDGVVYERVGIRLKGNSSLRGVAESAEPEALPWLIRLDEFVDGQDHDGVTELVVRSNSSATALNEAVALELLELAGLSSQDAIAVRFSVNGDTEVLRLVIEHPDDSWMADELDATGALYKAESTGDYSYRGDDPAAYDEVFDQEAGEDNADLTPLIEFLDFINNADDATFAAEIADRLDTDAFATYLAMQELLDNFDDIDGPGNNSYLYYDTASGQFTVVPWDYNLAFGARPTGGGGGDAGGAGGGGVDAGAPDAAGPPGGADAGGAVDAGAGRGGPGGSNVLSERFLAIGEYAALVEAKRAELAAGLFDSGVAAGILADWVTVLEAGAADLVDADTVASEAGQIAGYF